MRSVSLAGSPRPSWFSNLTSLRVVNRLLGLLGIAGVRLASGALDRPHLMLVHFEQDTDGLERYHRVLIHRIADAR